MVQPSGPNNQRCKSSGVVQASKTSLRGASKSRIITISRSVGVVTSRVPLFFIGSLLKSVRALTFLLFDVFERWFENLKAALPSPIVASQPDVDLRKRLGQFGH